MRPCRRWSPRCLVRARYRGSVGPRDCGPRQPRLTALARPCDPPCRRALHPGAPFPVSKTGLHCGTPGTVGVPAGLDAIPGLQDRAPLRHGDERLSQIESTLHSRSPRPGSIAASGLPVVASSTWPSIPGLQDRAPLRPRSSQADSSTARTHSRSPRPGSIAAHSRGGRLSQANLPFPVSKTGLHCGASNTAQVTSSTRTHSRSPRPGSIAASRSAGPVASASTPHSRSPRPGSIAAPRIWAVVLIRIAPIPGLQDRAPLRHRRSRADDREHGHPFPVSKTGLHCGPLRA